MRKKMMSCVIFTLMINTVFLVTVQMNSSASSPTIEYQIGCKAQMNGDLLEFWSEWASDGDEAGATYDTWSIPGTLALKVKAPGYHIEYQIGYKLHWGEVIIKEFWSDWESDGQEANVTFDEFSFGGTFAMRIRAPGYHVEYQLGYKFEFGEYLFDYPSNWTSDGDEACSRYTSWCSRATLYMKAVMILPAQAMLDIDPDTLNLKSKGRWITCYIDLPGYNVSEIDISTILLEDVIPAEWGDIQGDILMVKFDKSEVEDMLVPGTYNLKVTGELGDGSEFEGYSDEVRVIAPPK